MLLLLLCSTVFGVLTFYRLWKVPRSPYPPGPPGLPIFRNLFDWPTKNRGEVFAEWRRIYGDIVHAHVAGTHMIILNSYEVAMEMLAKKGANYSDRPPSFFASELVGWKNGTALRNDGPQLKEIRRLFAQEIGTKDRLERFAPMTQVKVARFLCRLLDEKQPEKLLSHLQTLIGSIILDVTYGYDVKDNTDSLISLVARVTEEFSASSVPAANFVDALPWLSYLPSWLPGFHFKTIASQMRSRLEKMVETPFSYVRDQVRSGTARVSFVASNLEKKKLTANHEHVLKWAAASMYSGGADTTVSIISQFLLFMSIFPEAQAKAQAEIDAVIGQARLPTLADRSQLPYVEAMVKEVLRFGRIAPQGVPHRSRENDIHNGYYIPQNSVIVTNIEAMSRDEQKYRNPNKFDPLRFTGQEPELDPINYMFGFGRRICPGRFFAFNNMFIICATILAVMKVSPASGGDGEEMLPKVEYAGGLVVHPKACRCQILPRSPQAELLLRSGLEFDTLRVPTTPAE